MQRVKLKTKSGFLKHIENQLADAALHRDYGVLTRRCIILRTMGIMQRLISRM